MCHGTKWEGPGEVKIRKGIVIFHALNSLFTVLSY